MWRQVLVAGAATFAVALSCSDTQSGGTPAGGNGTTDAGEAPGAGSDGDDPKGGASGQQGGAAAGGGGGESVGGIAESGAGFGGDSTAAGQSGAAGAAGGEGGQGSLPGGMCGCPDGFVYDPGKVDGYEPVGVKALTYPACVPPPGECQAPGSTCTRNHASAKCVNGACQIEACLPRWGDCDRDPDNGCEADLASPETCGSCVKQCTQGQSCAEEGCVDACDPPRTICSGRCSNLGSSEVDCGACGTECTGRTCAGGTCGMPCAEGFTLCNNQCVLGACPVESAACNLCPPLNGPDRPCGYDSPATNCCGGGSGDFHYSFLPDNYHVCTDSSSLIRCDDDCADELAWVTGLGAPEHLLVDGGNVFWADPGAGTVGGAAEADGEPWTVASALAKPRRLALADGKVYWSDELGGAVMRADEQGGSSPELVALADKPYGLAVDESYVYWADVGSSSLLRAPRGGGDATQIWQGFKPDPDGPPNQDAELVAVDEQSIYWTLRSWTTSAQQSSVVIWNKQTLQRTSGYGLGSVPTSSRMNVTDLSLREGVVSVVAIDAYGSFEDLRVHASASTEDGGVLLSLGKSSIPKLVSVVRGAEYTYWSDGSSVVRVPNCSGASRTLAVFTGTVRSLALSDQYLYFAVDDWIGRLAL